MFAIFILFFSYSIIVTAQEKASVDKYFNTKLSEKERDSLNVLLETWTNIIKNDSTNIEAYFNRGNVLINLGMHHKAYYDFTKVIKLDSSNAAAYYNRAISRTRYGYNLDACSDLYHALKLGLKEAEIIYNKKCGYYKKQIEQNK